MPEDQTGSHISSLLRRELGHSGAAKGVKTQGQSLLLEPQLCCPLNGLGQSETDVFQGALRANSR